MADNSIMLWENCVPDNLCDDLINVLKLVEKTNPSILTNGEVQYDGGHNRKDYSLFLEDLKADLCFFVNENLTQCLVEYADVFSVLQQIQLRSIQQKLQYTPVGGGYHTWHFESDKLDTSNRVLAWTIYLNDVEEGGETEFLYKPKRIKPTKGTVCIFPASFNYTHRGNPPISNEKYILTGWWKLF